MQVPIAWARHAGCAGSRSTPAVRQASAAGMSPEASIGKAKQPTVPGVKIPAKYRRYDTSAIAIEVGADAKNEFDIKLD